MQDYKDELHRYLAMAGKKPLLTEAQEKALSVVINSKKARKRQKEKAIKTLIESNLLLAARLAIDFPYFDHELMDKIGDGNLGLSIAARRYNARKARKGKGRFSTYATYWIMRYIYQGVYERHHCDVHLPVNLLSQIRQMKRFLDTHPGASDEIIADALKTELRAVKTLKYIDGIRIVPTDSDPENIREIPDTTVRTPYEEACTRELVRIVNKAMDSLGLGEDEKTLVAGGDTSNFVQDVLTAKMAAARGVGKTRIRMLKQELLWRVRWRIMTMMSHKEFSEVSSKILPRQWKLKTLDTFKDATAIRHLKNDHDYLV